MISQKLKWALIVGAFLLIGGVALVVGFEMAGMDVLGWFSTKYAMIVYFFVGAYVLMLVGFWVSDYVHR